MSVSVQPPLMDETTSDTYNDVSDGQVATTVDILQMEYDAFLSKLISWICRQRESELYNPWL